MNARTHTIPLRVRYSETDQMGTFYNSRALEWFEVGRTEYLRALGLPYAECEQRGMMLPLTEAHVSYDGRARYDDQLSVEVSARLEGRARLRFEVKVAKVDSGAPVCAGYTVHAFVDSAGKPIRPPAWFLEMLSDGQSS